MDWEENGYNTHPAHGVGWADDALTTSVIIQAAVGYIQLEQTQQPRHIVPRSFMGLVWVLFMCLPGCNLLRVQPSVNHKFLEMFQMVARSNHPFDGYRGIILPT